MSEAPAVADLESGRASLPVRLLRYRRLLRLKPYDTSTPEGRSAERYRRVAWSTLISGIARVAGLATSFISVPLVIGYLDPQSYGMWLMMSSLVAALGPLDLGIGLGLLTVVSDAYGRDDKERARRAISTAAAMLTLISAIAALVFAVLFFVIPWARVFNVTDPTAISQAGPTAAVLFGAFALGLPLGITAQVQLAHQSGYISSAWAILGNLGSLAALILVVNAHGSLPILLVALTGVGLMTALLNGFFLFRRQRPWLMPRLRDVDLHMARPLLKTGSLFLVLQLSALVAYQLDNMVIGQIMGAQAVAEYAVPAKLFVIAPTLLAFVLTPLWPAYREAFARGDVPWAKRTLARSIKLAASINVPNAVVMVFAAPFILQVWVHAAKDPLVTHPSMLLLLGFGTWTLMNTLNGPLAMILNGANVVGFQVVCSICMAIANVTISILLVQHIGVSGAVWGSAIAQLFFIMIPQAWYARRLLKRLSAGQQSPSSA